MNARHERGATKLPLPGLRDSDRRLYENAYRQGDYSIMFAISLDAQVRTLARELNDSHDIERIRDKTEVIKEQMMTIFTGTTHANWLHYFRTKANIALLTEAVLTPYLFHDDELSSERTQLTNGVSGISTELLEEAMNYLAKPNTNRDEKAHLIGAMSELTALSLLNRPQISSEITLQSSTLEDQRQMTDCIFYEVNALGTTKQRIQIKTHPHFEQVRDLRHRGIAVITASTMRNQNFRTSRELIDEHRGDGTIGSSKRLNDISSELLASVKSTRDYQLQKLGSVSLRTDAH